MPAQPNLSLKTITEAPLQSPRPRPATRFLLYTAAALALFLSGVRAQTVTEVRVGSHPGFTRVVFESDAALRATTAQPRPGVVEVCLEGAGASTPELEDPGKKLKSLSFRPDASSLVVSLEPGFDNFSLRRYRITRPHRLVLDISPQSGAVEETAAPAVEEPTLAGDSIRWIAGAVILAALSSSGALLIFLNSRRRAPRVEAHRRDLDSSSRQKITDLDLRIQQQMAAYRRLVERREES